MTLWDWLLLPLGVLMGASWQWVKPGGTLELRVRLRDCLNEIWRLSNHPAGRDLSNVVPLRQVKSVGGSK